MALEPAGIASERKGVGIVRSEQVSTGGKGNGHGGTGNGKDGGRIVYKVGDVDDFGDADELSGENSLQMGLEDRGFYADGESIEIAVASHDEAMALLGESGLTVRDRADMADFLEQHYGRGSRNRQEAGRYLVGDGEKKKAAARERVIWDRMVGRDLMGDVGVLSLWDDVAGAMANEEDDLRAASMEEEALGVDDEVDDDDGDAISAKHDTDPSLEDGLELWAGADSDDPDGIADAFDRRVERVLARGNERYSK